MSRRWGAGTAAIARTLLLSTTDFRQSHLAEMAGVSQPRVSQVLDAFENLGAVSRTHRGWHANRGALIEAYLAKVRPRQTSEETYWYGLDGLRGQVTAVVAQVQGAAAVSADLAPDYIAPWRSPTVVVVWLTRPLVPAGLVPAESRASATLILRSSDDEHLFSTVGIHEGLPLANVLQQAIDLNDLGGEDRAEAADYLLGRAFQAVT